MFDNEYEEYMRSVLGYPSMTGTYYNGQNPFPYRNIDYASAYSNLYPEIYNKLNPLIMEACNNFRSTTISKEDIDKSTNEIFTRYEAEENRANSASKQNTSRACAQCNPLLKDLIKILLINQIINNNQNRPPINQYPPINRPPRPREGMDMY